MVSTHRGEKFSDHLTLDSMIYIYIIITFWQVGGLIVTEELRMVLISTCLFHPIALSFIASKWSYCYWEIENGVDLCLSVLPCFSLICSM